MKRMPVVSVIMPALDEAPFIEEAISAIPVDKLTSSGYGTEILVVDNGSLDGTGDLARAAGAKVLLDPGRGVRVCLQDGIQQG